MSRLIFWEKPGCAGNARQQALLREAGHELEVRDLLSEPWTRARLLTFLAGLPVAEWFNRAAPAVKSGEVVPEELGADEAVEMLLREPLLIRRPLIESESGARLVGFDQARVRAWVGLAAGAAEVGEGCAAASRGICSAGEGAA